MTTKETEARIRQWADRFKQAAIAYERYMEGRVVLTAEESEQAAQLHDNMMQASLEWMKASRG